MRLSKIEVGHYKVTGTDLEVIRYQKYNGHAHRDHWKLVTPAGKVRPEYVHHTARLLEDVKIWLFQNWAGSMANAVVKNKVRRRKRR
ncbi:MAG: hypothetical protein COB09_18805 [Thalassobium sp.]|nr:MAG: hypothetical protein COB09_18805 [Thalassobium sp.]